MAHLERLDLTIQEPQLWLQTGTAVLSYDREKKGTQSLETLLRVQNQQGCRTSYEDRIRESHH